MNNEMLVQEIVCKKCLIKAQCEKKIDDRCNLYYKSLEVVNRKEEEMKNCANCKYFRKMRKEETIWDDKFGPEVVVRHFTTCTILPNNIPVDRCCKDWELSEEKKEETLFENKNQ